jgi:hypothetical protein
MMFTLHQTLFGDQVKEEDFAEACGKYGGDENTYSALV